MASNEVMGYGGPICNGLHATDLSNPTEPKHEYSKGFIAFCNAMGVTPSQEGWNLYRRTRASQLEEPELEYRPTDVPDVKEREAAQGENQTLRATSQPSPKEELELEADNIIKNIWPYGKPYPNSVVLSRGIDERIFQMPMALLVRSIQNLIHQAVIKELESLPLLSLLNEEKFYGYTEAEKEDRIKQLKRSIQSHE